MTVQVVEGLEVVEIQIDQGSMVVAALAVAHRLLQVLPQQAAVGQVGERVVEGQLADLLLQALALGDIACDAVVADEFALLVVVGLDQDLTPDQATILAVLLHLQLLRPVLI